jgi:hypothetical protein
MTYVDISHYRYKINIINRIHWTLGAVPKPRPTGQKVLEHVSSPISVLLTYSPHSTSSLTSLLMWQWFVLVSSSIALLHLGYLYWCLLRLRPWSQAS